MFNDVDARNQIRGTLAEEIILAARVADGPISRTAAVAAIGGDSQEAATLVEWLRSLGLTDPEPSLAAEVTLTAQGKRLAAAIARDRVSGAARRDAIRHSLLEWIDSGERQKIEDFDGHENATAYGVPFALAEIIQEAKYLKERGLIGGLGVFCEVGFIRPAVASLGRACLDSGRPVSQFLDGAAPSSVTNVRDQSVTVGGNVLGGAVVAGDGNTTTVTQNLTIDQRFMVVQEIGRLRGILDADDAEEPELREHLEVIASTARDTTADKRTLMRRMMEGALIAASTEAGEKVVALLTALASSLSG